MACLFGHKWNGCKCTKCGAVRDEQHDFVPVGCIKKCSICGKELAGVHKAGNDYRCSICGGICFTCDKTFTGEENAFLIGALIAGKGLASDAKELDVLSKIEHTFELCKSFSNTPLVKDDLSVLMATLNIYEQRYIPSQVLPFMQAEQRLWCQALTIKLFSIYVFYNDEPNRSVDFFGGINGDDKLVILKLIDYEISTIEASVTHYRQRMNEVRLMFDNESKPISAADLKLIQYAIIRLILRGVKKEPAIYPFLESADIDESALDRVFNKAMGIK